MTVQCERQLGELLAEASWLGTAAAKGPIVEFLHTTRLLGDWLDRHVGPSTMPARER